MSLRPVGFTVINRADFHAEKFRSKAGRLGALLVESCHARSHLTSTVRWCATGKSGRTRAQSAGARSPATLRLGGSGTSGVRCREQRRQKPDGLLPIGTVEAISVI